MIENFKSSKFEINLMRVKKLIIFYDMIIVKDRKILSLLLDL